MFYSLVTFGCQMNEHDSERMRDVLEAAGHVHTTELAQAELVVLNTCTVRDKAEHKLRSEVGRLGLVKKTRPELLIVVAGCVAQQEGEKLIRKMPVIDLVIGPDNISELPALLVDLESGPGPRVRTVFDVEAPHFLSARPRPGQHQASAYVTVMKGCDERCSFCIVPYTRGPERYRSSQEIIDEIAGLAAAGVSEITLLGQTVNSYIDPLGALPVAPGAGHSPWSKTLPSRLTEDESQFAALLRSIADRVPRLKRLRYASPHPRHLIPSLILAHQELPVLARHVHLPVQSGSSRILKRMIRRYDIEEYIERAETLLHAVDGMALSTDVIVGFPGETEQDFQLTVELMRRFRFTQVFGFKYSPRPNTPALKLADDVEESEKARRLAALFEVTDEIRREHLLSLVGTEQRVLVEGAGQGKSFSGRTERNEIVHFGSRVDLTGEIVSLRIASAFKNSLSGEMLDPALAAPLRSPAEDSEANSPVVPALPVQEHRLRQSRHSLKVI